MFDKKYLVVIQAVTLSSAKRIKKELDSIGHSSYIQIDEYEKSQSSHMTGGDSLPLVKK